MSKTRIITSLARRFIATSLALKVCKHPIILSQNFTNPVSFTPSLSFSRTYAKGKNIKKEKGKGKVQIDERAIADAVNVDTLKTNFQKAIEVLKDDFIKNVSLRSSAGSIESLIVNVDGNEHTLQELAQIVRKNPKTIVINMAVFPQAIPDVLTAISKSGMNLNPQQEGTTLYVPIPKVTKEHRENLAKNAKMLFVKCKSSIRDVQLKANKNMKKIEGMSSDDLRNIEKQVIALADTYIKEAENILEAKQTELVGKD